MAYVHCKCGFVKKDIPDKYIDKIAKCPKCKASILIKKKGAPHKTEKEPAKKICPKCGYGNKQASESCPKCGIIYKKWADKALHESNN